MIYDKPFYLTSNLMEEEKFRSLDKHTQKLIQQLNENGYCVFKPELGDGVIEQAISDCASEYNRVDYKGSGNSRIQDAFLFSQAVKKIACNEGILHFLEHAFGRKAFPFQTLNFNVGTEQRTHSDSIHFNCFPYGFMCGVWIAFENVDLNNGPLHYYPGSHKLPFFGMEELGIHGADEKEAYEFYHEYENYVQELIGRLHLEKQVVNMEKGDCLIWVANLLHGGEPIVDKSRTRHSQVTHYYFEDCYYFTPLMSSPLKNEVFARRPYNILFKKKLTRKQQIAYARAAGIDITSLNAFKKSGRMMLRKLGLKW